MTQVILTRERNHKIGCKYSVEATGHATGSVQACAAVSTLIQTLQAWLHTSGAVIIEERVAKGDCMIRFAGNGTSTAFDMLCCGFRRIHATEPDKVALSIKT